MKIYSKTEIERAIDIPSLMQEMENGLRWASHGKAINAPVSFMHFESPKGDVHIKSGAFLDGEMYVVKIASGFYENPLLGLSSSNGAMILFSQKTGELIAILLDEGRLTDIRTALAGAIAAKYLAPPNISKIGIIGTGTQAKEQLVHLQHVTSCRNVLIWGRDQTKAKFFASDPRLKDYYIVIAQNIEKLTQDCNLIVTATSSSSPLIFGHQLQPGTHITAVGADDVGKQELDASVFDCADLIVVDGLVPCSCYGDLAHAKNINLNSVIELGRFIEEPQKRKSEWITIADLTGLGIEDLQIAKAIYARLNLS
ncbi:MAG: deaminase [Parachlamydiaceae bacterium]|nr:deaminase [Parachlamydiaceae bacterium]